MLNLIEPGDYNFSFNQKYLLEKLYTLDMYNFILYSFVVLVVLTLFSYCLINYYKNEKAKEIDKQIKDKIRETNEYIKENCEQLNDIAKQIWEDQNLFGRSEQLIKQMYYPVLRTIIRELSGNEHILHKYYKHVIPAYNYYKNELEKENKPNA